jgi:predicted methyltransferase
MIMKLSLLFLVVFTFACSHKDKYKDAPVPGSLEEAVESDARAEENTERDQYQHPQETLEFFGIKADMTVVEVGPGSGYYTEILAPYLAEKGQYIMAVPRVPSNPPPAMIENEKKLQDILLRNQQVHVKAKFMPFEPRDERNRIKTDFADMVLVFNHIHNWVAKQTSNDDFKLIYEILKPRGVMGVTQHRIVDGRKRIPKSGYMTEKEVIGLALKAGFKYAGRSDINANPKDKADYPDGVWVLPPTYRLGEKDHDRYEDIGESNRMTLKFVKP